MRELVVPVSWDQAFRAHFVNWRPRPDGAANRRFKTMRHINCLAITNVLADRKGITAAEYALVIAGVAIAIAAGATFLGKNVSTSLSSVGSYAKTATSGI